ncbi:hypothetical protein F5Y15DRAFT_416240 [Xylariaceae sp. FL0016]|nr:hypothetical protein F5Y15DRAFT_416240 [Xylariaceae sp. FL0016]
MASTPKSPHTPSQAGSPSQVYEGSPSDSPPLLTGEPAVLPELSSTRSAQPGPGRQHSPEDTSSRREFSGSGAHPGSSQQHPTEHPASGGDGSSSIRIAPSAEKGRRSRAASEDDRVGPMPPPQSWLHAHRPWKNLRARYYLDDWPSCSQIFLAIFLFLVLNALGLLLLTYLASRHSALVDVPCSRHVLILSSMVKSSTEDYFQGLIGFSTFQSRDTADICYAASQTSSSYAALLG